MSRTRRFLDGVVLTYANQIVVMVVGLWLTPFLLKHLGQNDFGLWLIGLKALSYLSLLDIGVLGLLPREVAFAKGRIANGEPAGLLRTLIEETSMVVLSQVPLLILAAWAAWILLPLHGQIIRNSVAVILIAFVVQFPLKVFYAALEGLQELGFLGGLQMAAWAAGLSVNIFMILKGQGLYGLAVGWAVTQAVVTAGSIWHFYRRFPECAPRRLRRLSLKEYGHYLGAGIWVSIGQVATLLKTSDLLLLGKVLGPAAVVDFSCTQKLSAIGANQPLVIMQSAQPALSELRAAGDRKHLARVVASLTQAMLLLSGAVSIAVIAINHAFVVRWVGKVHYLGMWISVVILLEMVLRHWNVTTIYSLFSLGKQRHISTVGVIDGAVTAVVSYILIRLMGPVGAPLGAAAACAMVSLPWNLTVLGRELDSPIGELLRPLSDWAVRFVPLLCLVGIAGEFWVPRTYPAIAAVGVTALALYAATQWGVVQRSHWIGHLRQQTSALTSMFKKREPQVVS